eukprot:TRINITY_DN592_c0_g2_i1.p1 TRINITY_DN592_c0_g2~~TRINITY_DN592_c0_g2_i1.p1  ORF type:complete len:147 (+),score=17.64 TRINITY_DN592_c0_g2_i1:46-486(+)
MAFALYTSPGIEPLTPSPPAGGGSLMGMFKRRSRRLASHDSPQRPQSPRLAPCCPQGSPGDRSATPRRREVLSEGGTITPLPGPPALPPLNSSTRSQPVSSGMSTPTSPSTSASSTRLCDLHHRRSAILSELRLLEDEIASLAADA